ncbi:hypothetical protein ES706_02369 [subsurface metagenome]
MKREIERALGIGWISERVERLVVAPDWFSFGVFKVFQLFLAWGVLLLGFGFAPAVVVIFLLDFFDGSLISGRIGKAEKGLYLKYRVLDWSFDYVVFLPIWLYIIELYPVLFPLFSIWFLATPALCIGGMVVPEVLAFKPPTAVLFVLALFGFNPALIGLAVGINPTLEAWIHSDQWKLKGVRAIALVFIACLLWTTFAWAMGLGSSLGIIVAILPP